MRPNVSFKSYREARGHKGVGASFLAYGFSAIKAQSFRGNTKIAALLRQGRQWAEDTSETISRPTFEEQEFSVKELIGESSGTSIEVILGNDQGVRPRNLSWLGAHNADQWAEVLRIKTPVGGVYLETSRFSPNIIINVINAEGNTSSVTLDKPEYYYPHEFPGIKAESISGIEKALVKNSGKSR